MQKDRFTLLWCCKDMPDFLKLVAGTRRVSNFLEHTKGKMKLYHHTHVSNYPLQKLPESSKRSWDLVM